MIKVTFNLEVTGKPSHDAVFTGVVVLGNMAEYSVQLSDPDQSGVYTGSVWVPRGVERRVGIDQRIDGINDVVKGFGYIKFFEDKGFTAAVSFP